MNRACSSNLPASIPPSSRLLSAADFHRLADVPLEIECFANIDNPQTRRAYKNALEDFIKFIGIERPEEFREITRAHIIAWRGRPKVSGIEWHYVSFPVKETIQK